jgi:hypothetical protein
VTGPQGFTGFTGPRGFTGFTGPQGYTGPTGVVNVVAQNPVIAPDVSEFNSMYYNTTQSIVTYGASFISATSLINLQPGYKGQVVNIQNKSGATIFVTASLGQFKDITLTTLASLELKAVNGGSFVSLVFSGDANDNTWLVLVKSV